MWNAIKKEIRFFSCVLCFSRPEFFSFLLCRWEKKKEIKGFKKKKTTRSGKMCCCCLEQQRHTWLSLALFFFRLFYCFFLLTRYKIERGKKIWARKTFRQEKKGFDSRRNSTKGSHPHAFVQTWRKLRLGACLFSALPFVSKHKTPRSRCSNRKKPNQKQNLLIVLAGLFGKRNEGREDWDEGKRGGEWDFENLMGRKN